VSYTYDTLGRLKSVSHAGGVNSGLASSYSYDDADNRTQVTVTGTGAPSFTINNASATEGGTVTFTVTRAGSTAGTDTVQYATANGTAIAGADYTSKSGTLTFNPGAASLQVSVTTLQDTLVEGNETFNVNLSNPSAGATIADSQGVGTIIDDDSTPTCNGVSFTISSNGAVTEGANSVFTVTESGTTSSSCSVNYATSGGTATAGSDFTTTSGTLTFAAPGTKTVTVPTIDDTIVESPETFSMALSSPSGAATLGNPSSATATINDNDGTQSPTPVNDTGSQAVCTTADYNVVQNDTDPGGNYPLSLVSVTPSTSGFTVISSTTIEYMSGTRAGTNTATYTVQNSKGATATGTLTVTVFAGTCTQ